MTNEPTKRASVAKRSIEEVYEQIKASGFRSPSESTQIVREMRDQRTEHLANLVLGPAKSENK
jgi:hypothetical protein